jgi:hypothetical protein
MKIFALCLTVLLTTLCAAGTASAGVAVAFVQQDRYVDIPFPPWEKDIVMKDLDQFFVKMGAKWLPAGHDLKIEVLDIDLAGNLQSGPNGRQIRVLSGGADWPMIEVRYTLESGGKTLRTGTDRVSDMDYFRSHVTNPSKNTESLFYEKRMLEDWFKAKFAATAK